MRQHAARGALLIAAAVAAALTLTACSSGGGGGDDVPDPFDLLTDMRGQRLQTIVQDADVLLIPGLHLQYAVPSGGGEPPQPKQEAWGASCMGASCTIAQNTAIEVRDLFDLSVIVRPEEARLDTRAGFNTLVSTSRLRLAEDILGQGINLSSPSVTNYGFWGEHGFAGVLIGEGPFSGSVAVGGVRTSLPFDGSVAMAFAAGHISDRALMEDPGGSLDAIWEGLVEAVSTRTFDRREGTVHISITNLSNPRASVIIDLGGNRVGPSSGWADLPITDNGFNTGTFGDDYLAGSFHGPNHGEAYGVFDVETFTGAFGAKRTK